MIKEELLLDIVHVIGEACARNSRLLSWVVLVSFLLNVPVLFGYERLLPSLFKPPISGGVDLFFVVEYLSVAALPVFVVDAIGWLFHYLAWKKVSGMDDDEQKKVVRVPVCLRWSSSCLGHIAGQIVAVLLLTANLFVDVHSRLAETIATRGFMVGIFVIAVVGIGSFLGLVSSLEYAFIFWKANEANEAIGRTFGGCKE